MLIVNVSNLNPLALQGHVVMFFQYISCYVIVFNKISITASRYTMTNYINVQEF